MSILCLIDIKIRFDISELYVSFSNLKFLHLYLIRVFDNDNILMSKSITIKTLQEKKQNVCNMVNMLSQMFLVKFTLFQITTNKSNKFNWNLKIVELKSEG